MPPVTNTFEELRLVENEITREELWKNTKAILLKSVALTISLPLLQKRKEWLSEETIQKAAEKRAARHGNPSKYKELKATVQKLVKKDKQIYTDNMCREMKTEAKRGNTRSLFKLIKSLVNERKVGLNVIKSSAGKVLVEPEAIASRWKEYIEELYYDEDSDQQRSTNVTLEPSPLRSEVEKAMQSVNLKKAPGADGVPVELLRYGGPKVIDAMHEICQEVWKTEKWPED